MQLSNSKKRLKMRMRYFLWWCSSSSHRGLRLMFKDPNCSHSEFQGPYIFTTAPSYLNTCPSNWDVNLMNLFATKRLRKHFPATVFINTPNYGLLPLPPPSRNRSVSSHIKLYFNFHLSINMAYPTESCNHGILLRRKNAYPSIFII